MQVGRRHRCSRSNTTKDDERLDIVGVWLRKEVADHEIFALGSSAYRDLAHRGAFHGCDANRVTTISQ
jgi:hypothetical protein